MVCTEQSWSPSIAITKQVTVGVSSPLTMICDSGHRATTAMVWHCAHRSTTTMICHHSYRATPTMIIAAEIMMRAGQSPDRDVSPCTSNNSEHYLTLSNHDRRPWVNGEKHCRRPWFESCRAWSGKAGSPTIICRLAHRATTTIYCMVRIHVKSLSEKVIKTMPKRGWVKHEPLCHFGQP